MTHFWLNKGLVATGLVAKFSVAYWSISAVAIALAAGHDRAGVDVGQPAFPRRTAKGRTARRLIKRRCKPVRPPETGGGFSFRCNSFSHPNRPNIEMRSPRC
jgi:hypothetical protein